MSSKLGPQQLHPAQHSRGWGFPGGLLGAPMEPTPEVRQWGFPGEDRTGNHHSINALQLPPSVGALTPAFPNRVTQA